MGLERTQELLAHMGNPERGLRFVHVTGSNGKGSTCAMVERVLREAGYRTGLFTSPFVCEFNERIRVNGVNISDRELAEITEEVSVLADAMEDHPSQFELITAIGMRYFARRKCDIVILEVGMGGELDSTNVIPAPEAAAFTNIGLEHTEYLGDTIAEIASTKAGIVKTGCEVVCYHSVPEAVETIRQICLRKAVPFHLVDQVQITPLKATIDGQTFLYRGSLRKLSLLGKHQLHNCAVAIEILRILKRRGCAISEEAMNTGLAETVWTARFEVLTKEPLFILDGGHNPQCAEALVSTLAELLPEQKAVFLTGVLKDKDYKRIAALIAPFAKACVCVTPENPRALSAENYAREYLAAGIETAVSNTLEEGVEEAVRLAGTSPVIAFGSLYMAGAIRKIVRNREKEK